MSTTSCPWLASYPVEVSHKLSYPDIPLYELLLQTAQAHPDTPAIFFMGKEMTYAQLLEDCYRFANALQQLGVTKGDRIAIMLPNIPQSVIAYYGALLVGAIVVQTNPLYTERELLHQMSDSGAKVIVCLDLLYPRVKRIKQDTMLQHLIVTGIKDYLPLAKKLFYPFVQWKQRQRVQVKEGEDAGVYAFTSLLARSISAPVRTPADVRHDVALIQYTGGTTGKAKGAMLTHANLIANVIQCGAWFYKARQGEERILAAIPFFHVYGMTVAMNFGIYMGAKLILVPRFDVSMMLKLIDNQKPTVFPGAPTMYIGLLSHPELSKYNISSIEACLSGSAPLPVEVQQKFEAITNGKLVEGYGLTECSPVTHANPIWGRRVNGSIGLPWPDTECRVVDIETGEDVLPGSVGELCVRGPQVMKGYWNCEEETHASLQDGWFFTGDIGSMDENGYFYIVDRKKDMIIASGFNIYPREIEEVLYEHPAVKEAVVIGVPDEYRGETVKAYIVMRKDEEVTNEELDKYCRKKLASFKVPHLYEFRDELPKTAVGKILRRTLIEEERNKLQTK
ncbi:long-chain fatty acid--CoA ligase [Aneurinibacillus migulanus]|uniref:AMP-binding protein n=1 Tax=Aneurinibacillus migulanus TaxID=47500 RepID=UPI0005BC73C4|nr:AMP-binding protein [Aneurinibacillus migulanus]KIV51687.1 long-chain fatty acid--CoA ligase [Aneurinibacillus migulanus]KPD05689.1 long-chain fatty acid--CoA ligase [Aneurinibacillus migulanus]MCP1355218.1 AMP-binding protein [Aneurinibacillus migulanus]MED4729129.1 AMP-binding protein [Aneurinibacillus migulanus]